MIPEITTDKQLALKDYMLDSARLQLQNIIFPSCYHDWLSISWIENCARLPVKWVYIFIAVPIAEKHFLTMFTTTVWSSFTFNQYS